MAMLKRGLSGEPVKRLQEKLDVDADGVFGPATDKALRDYQRTHGLSADGIAGPDTFAQMGLYELILLQKGSKGETVKRLQQALGTEADGIFGGGTEKALKAFQESQGVAADGLAGPETLAQMDLFSEITSETIRMSKVPKDSVQEEAVIKSADASGGTSIWNTIKGLFN